MCGRYKLTTNADQLKLAFPWVDNDDYFDIHGPWDRHEIFPGTLILSINNQLKPEEDWWTIRDRTWDGKMISVINAKAETISKVSMFREAFKNDRVLIPGTGLFEWQEQPDKKKKKFEIWFDEPVFAFGGIARSCEIGGERRRCAVIITTTANAVFRGIHNTKQRQAVVIRRVDHERWLDPNTSADDLKRMMEPLPEAETHFKPA